MAGSVAVIAGSRSDEGVVNETVEVLKEFGVSFDVQYLSAHRERRLLEEYISKSQADIFIAIAGLAAHLPGVIASQTVKPVIGVPVSAKLGGLDSLLSIVQMPSRVPVACVGIDNGRNAAYLAIQMLGLEDEVLARKMKEFRRL